MTEGFFPKNPYIGPRSFRAGEQLYGRELELRNLFYLLTAERIILLHSPSGAGKTSLIQAALIEKLRKEHFRVLPVMRVSTEPPAFTRPLSSELVHEQPAARRAPNRYLLSAIQSLEEGLPEHLRLPEWELLKLSFDSYLSRRPGAAADQDCEVLIFDQFEEIITTEPTDSAGKLRFFDEVGQALRDSRRWALFAIREEYIGPLEPYISRIPTRLTQRFRLDLLSLSAAKSAIRYPARDVRVAFTDAAATRLAENLARVQVQQVDGTSAPRLGQYVEPVQLQVVCRQLWNELAIRRKQQLLAAGPDLLNILLQAPSAPPITVADLSAAGDVDQALARYYDGQIHVALATGARERAIRDWVEQQLITADGLRSQVLRTPDATKGLLNTAIQALIEGHLIRAEPRLGATWYELAHDRLIEPIRASNAAWREKHLYTLQKQAELWDQSGQQKGLLLSDEALVEAEQWAKANDADLTQRDRDFLRACLYSRYQAEAEHRSLVQARQSARWRMFSMSIVAVLAIMSYLVSSETATDAQGVNATSVSWQKQAIANASEAQTAKAANDQAEADRQNASRLVATGQLAQQNANQTVTAAQTAFAASAKTTLAIQATSEVLKNVQIAAGPTIAALLGDTVAYQEQIYQANVAAANAVRARQTAEAERDVAQAAQTSVAVTINVATQATVGPAQTSAVDAQATASAAQASVADAQASAADAQARASAAQTSAADAQTTASAVEASAAAVQAQASAAQQQIIQLQAQLTAVAQQPSVPNVQQPVPDTSVPDPAQSQDTPTQRAP